uniref:Uncharacterized protein n=1 Tax=Ochrobactrum sp. LM19 TaxID=1449781 RepID=A0A0D5A0N2_9HYPH|nr:hypothetical protein [Ochrobactrum sp. LM19]AJW29969.1 hypothetical protein pLM19O2_p24 [Ochrobactrum sp. LM19]
MRRLLLLLIFVTTVPLSTGVLAANVTSECKDIAISDLRQFSPDGYRVFEQATDKRQFFGWFNCKDIVLDTATAVHETVHTITEELDTFPLINGNSLSRPHEASALAPPKAIAQAMRKAFGADDIFVQTYLATGPAAASSSDDFLYLLDELNAFSHDLNVASKLSSHVKMQNEVQVDHRDGLAALMAFVTGYSSTMAVGDQSTWLGLQQVDINNTLRVLWEQGEAVLGASCGIPDFGSKDRVYIGYFCDPLHNGAITQLLGREPVCPRKCLSSD